MTRDHKLIAVFTAIALCAGGAVAARMAVGDVPPVRAVDRTVGESNAPSPDGRLTVQFMGDTLLGDEAQRRIDRHGYDWPLAAIRRAINADVSIAVGEGPFTNRTELWNTKKKYSYTSHPAAAAALARAGIDALALANNHVFDAGAPGLADTMRHAKAAGIDTFGAGPDLARAEQPLLLRSNVGTIGVVGFGESFGHQADVGVPGTMVLSTRAVQRGIHLARTAGATWVIAHVHWGDNYAPINAEQRAWAQQFADAGYDMVVGSGAHRSQPIEFIGSMPVFYGIGNFVFGTPGRWDDSYAAGMGLLVNLELSSRQSPRLSVRCLVTDNRVVAYRPRMCTPTEARGYLPTLYRGIVMQRDQGVLPCRCFARGKPS